MLAAIPVTKAKCWEPFPKSHCQESLSQTWALSWRPTEAGAAGHLLPKVTDPLYPLPPPPCLTLRLGQVSADLHFQLGQLRVREEKGTGQGLPSWRLSQGWARDPHSQLHTPVPSAASGISPEWHWRRLSTDRPADAHPEPPAPNPSPCCSHPQARSVPRICGQISHTHCWARLRWKQTGGPLSGQQRKSKAPGDFLQSKH